jgi:peptidyl-prolyl cis-trans isomerase C
MSRFIKPHVLVACIMVPVFISAACSPLPLQTDTPSATPTLTPTATETQEPMAVTVNGEGITIVEYEAELARYQQAQQALGEPVDLETASPVVLSDFVDSLLLEQGAAAGGFAVTDADVQSRVDALSAQVGGAGGLESWEATHGYSDADFRTTLRRQIACAWMRDQIIAAVPATAEQVHLKQILLYNADGAQQALGFLEAGWTFEDLAAQYDPLTRGELGWLPRGYLPSAAIEEAAFALEAGQNSGIVEDETGYHILYVVERDPARLLSPDALLTLQANAVQAWLTQQREASVIIYAPGL